MFSWLLLLFGCGKKHMLDGPGMENDQPWKAFTLSLADTYAQHNFWFTIEKGESSYILTGECRDEEGNECKLEHGVELSVKDTKYLRSLRLQELNDIAIFDDEDGLILLDAPQVLLVLTYLDDTEKKKAISKDISVQIYEHLLHYFKDN